MYDRRDVLRASGALLATGALAGCSGGGGGDGTDEGGLELSLVAAYTASEVTTAVYQGDGTATATRTAGTETTGRPTTRHTAAEDKTFIVAVLRMENTGSETVGLPAPGVANPPSAAGEMYLSGFGAKASPVSMVDDLIYEGEIYDSVTELVADRHWELPAGESFTGFMAWQMDEKVKLSNVSLTVNFDAGGEARFPLSDA